MACKKYIIAVFLLFIISGVVSGCSSSMKQNVAKEQAKKKAKAMGLNLANLKEGEACKYVGFIGDNSSSKAKQNGNIKFMMFSYTDGNFFKKCTYAYGK